MTDANVKISKLANVQWNTVNLKGGQDQANVQIEYSKQKGSSTALNKSLHKPTVAGLFR